MNSNNKTFNLVYTNINNLSNEQKKKLASFLNLKDEKELNLISYVLSDMKGNFKPFFKEAENCEISKRFLLGIQHVKSLDQFNLCLSKSNEETIHIISSGHNTMTNKIVDKFYENSSLFDKNTFNFINYYLKFSEGIKEEIFQSLVNKNEILIIFKPKFYNIETLKGVENLFIYEKNLKKLSKIDPNTKISNESLLALKYKPDKEENLDKALETFVNFIQKFIDKNNNSKDSIYPIERFYFTNNPNLASYYKLKFVNEKSKLAFVFVNQENMNKLNINETDINKLFIDIFESFKSNPNFKYLITNNSNVAKLFNIYCKSNENMTIRFIDFAKVVKYHECLNGDYDIINIKEKKDFENYNKNLLFYYKTLYDKKTINQDELKDFVEQFINSKQFTINSRNYLENLNYFYDENKKMKVVDGLNFKTKFLDIPGNKILYCISENCVGCSIVKGVFEKILDQNNNKFPEVFLYDIMNENINFKKIRKTPSLFLYCGDKLVKEVNLNTELSNDQISYENAVETFLLEKFL